MAVRIEDIDKAIAEVIGSFDGVKEVTAQQREGIVNYIQRKDTMLFLTVVACDSEIDILPARTRGLGPAVWWGLWVICRTNSEPLGI